MEFGYSLFHLVDNVMIFLSFLSVFFYKRAHSSTLLSNCLFLLCPSGILTQKQHLDIGHLFEAFPHISITNRFS